MNTVIGGMVSNPNAIKIDHTEDNMGILFTVKVHEEDKGKVLGRDGRIVEALRVVVRSAGRLADVRASLKIDAGTTFQLPVEKR